MGDCAGVGLGRRRYQPGSPRADVPTARGCPASGQPERQRCQRQPRGQVDLDRFVHRRRARACAAKPTRAYAASSAPSRNGCGCVAPTMPSAVAATDRLGDAQDQRQQQLAVPSPGRRLASRADRTARCRGEGPIPALTISISPTSRLMATPIWIIEEIASTVVRCLRETDHAGERRAGPTPASHPPGRAAVRRKKLRPSPDNMVIALHNPRTSAISACVDPQVGQSSPSARPTSCRTPQNWCRRESRDRRWTGRDSA